MNNDHQPIIIGFGPAGMFAALALIERGLAPVIFERGKKIEERDRDVLRFITARELDTESNIQFGEGGAGAYSDGKLFSRPTKNSPEAMKVFDTLIKFGAPETIRTITKPHLGTDVLCAIVKNIRDYILAHGGQIHYNAKMTDILITKGTAVGVVINDEEEYRSSLIYLAIGHSARDTFAMIHNHGIELAQKPISVGLRIEHPVEIINQIRAKPHEAPATQAATYSFTHNDKHSGRMVCSFCMCPGGEIVNASSELGFLVTNGMSYANRGSRYSNAAIVVQCQTSDYGSAEPLAGINFQKEIERKAFIAGESSWRVPAQNVLDFMAGKHSAVLNTNSCRTGTVAADMRDILPGFVSTALRTAFAAWQQEYPLFISEHGILLGAETRTTCPVRIARTEHYTSVSLAGLLPIGEGSGYAGGIMSAAIDALKAVAVSQPIHL